MQYHKIKHIIVTAVFGALPFALLSQEEQTEPEETINQDVQVVREYNPTISDAFKINDMPSPSDTLKITPVFRYHLKGKALGTPPEIVPLTPVHLGKEPLSELRPAYIQGYLGNYNIAGGNLYYNLVRNEKFALALNAAHESSLGDLTLDDGSDADADYHQTAAGLYMRHFMRKATLGVDMDFSNYSYRYYGLGNIAADDEYYSHYPTYITPEAPIYPIIHGSDILLDKKQRQTAFDINMSLSNRALRNANLYDIHLGFYTFGNYTGITENSFRYGGDFNIALGEINMLLETAINYAGSRTANVEAPAGYLFTSRDRMLAQINPSITRTYKNFFLKLGLRVGFGLDELGDKFYLSPDVAVHFKVEDVIVLQAGVTGDVKPNSYRSVMAENPFMAPDLNLRTAAHDFKLFAGIKGNFSSATSFAVRVEYGIFTDEHFFVNNMYHNADSSAVFYDNRFGAVYDDGTLLTVSGEFKAAITSDLNFTLRAAYYGWQLKEQAKAWHKPDMEIGIRAAYRAMHDLRFTAAFNVQGVQYAMMPPQADGNKYVAKKLNSLLDFNLGADYSLNSRWRFFAHVGNVFAAKQYQYNGYPLHRFNARVGVGYSF
ncbi:MAG: hypothetical protein LBV41_00400 [Cytophagaceae bacterium]|jgi:hypothetical protein|nr:hypothetical protein [Cytophagaceae bacterium]